MKRKRLKHVKKTLAFFKSNFGLGPPYNMLVDGTFCKAALTYKVNISEQAPKYFDAEVRLCTTPCVLAECEALGSLLFGPLKVLRQFEEVPCHHANPLPVSKCLHRMARKNKKANRKFIIATQDPELSEMVRKTPGAPLLYIAFNAFCLEAPSEKCKLQAEAILAAKLDPVEHLKELKRTILGEPEEEPKKRKRKKKGGPNPLSCKKSKKTKIQEGGRVEKKRRKRHRRVQISTHVKEAILQEKSGKG